MQDEKEYFKFRNGVILYPLFFVLLMWFVYWVELTFGMDLTRWGVKPRSLLGLRGIAFSPFIHSGLRHLLHNSMPLLVLSSALFYFYNAIAWRTLLWLVILSGLGTWIIGRPSFHIGMSSIIYALVAFLFFKGVVAKHYRLIALSLLVVFLYGSLIWGTLPLDAKISWEGHLSGFVSGGLLGLLRFRESVPKPMKYYWESSNYNEEDDPFMRQFDENGNFFELPTEIIAEEGKDYPAEGEDHTLEKPSKIVYTFKKSNDPDLNKEL